MTGVAVALDDGGGGDASDDFATWVHARGPALLRFAHLATGGSPDAADLVQEALVAAYPRWSRLARTATAEAYVRRSIVNASVSRWRRDRRLVSVADPEPHGSVLADPAEGLTDSTVAWDLCRTLPPVQRAAVVLRFFEDRTFAEVAAVLGCREATARSHVHRALAALRTRLAEEGDDD
ncbi:MAG TPA: SigE family RNA polymerase sigma factor [Nocardioides sp.]